MSDPYECVPTALKLKSSSSKNKKKKHKKKDRQEESHQETAEKNADQGSYSPERTKAELAFRKIQEKRQLNAYLDSLTEHYDIPKVSWTK
ncbi:Protein FAM32A-like [Trichoplax sp. H2]|nr:Protein FAM32A-like [Trichoplax sp. H2]|eukprot:RDD41832.1 Protein FAM32A-like [Trichoplax sp. H2]